jgi:hypothetical protein
LGTEKGLTTKIKAIAGGERGPEPKKPEGGMSPNHWMLFVCALYGWSPEAHGGKLLEFLEVMRRHGHMTRAAACEFGTGSHFAWWATGWFGSWLFALRAGPGEVLTAVERCIRAELAVQNLCATPKGRIVMPGARCHIGRGMADQTVQRDRCRALLLGSRVRMPEGLDSLDWAPLWLLLRVREEFPQAIRRVGAAGPNDLPVLVRPMHVQRSPAGHVAWFDDCEGMLRPAYWAWVNYQTGEERYGIDPQAPRGQRGGRRPEDLPVPECPGEGPREFVVRAAT